MNNFLLYLMMKYGLFFCFWLLFHLPCWLDQWSVLGKVLMQKDWVRWYWCFHFVRLCCCFLTLWIHESRVDICSLEVACYFLLWKLTVPMYGTLSRANDSTLIRPSVTWFSPWPLFRPLARIGSMPPSLLHHGGLVFWYVSHGIYMI